jgi:tight adherence protein C
VTAAALAGLAGAVGAAGAILLLPTPRQLAPQSRRLGLLRALIRAGGVGALGRARAPRDLEARIAAAGRPGGLGAQALMAAKLAALALGVVVGTVLGALAPGRLGLLLVLATPVAGFVGPDLWLRRRAVERAACVRRELPYLLDLLRVTIDAGMPLATALGAVGERASGPLAEGWRAVGAQVGLGVPLGEALDEMCARVPLEEVRSLVTALERASRHGAPLGETLGAQARDARLARRRRIQEEAARAGPKIQLVVALLLVPSVLLLVAAALAAGLVEGGTAIGVG